jgi:hypothetical protein
MNAATAYALWDKPIPKKARIRLNVAKTIRRCSRRKDDQALFPEAPHERADEKRLHRDAYDAHPGEQQPDIALHDFQRYVAEDVAAREQREAGLKKRKCQECYKRE